MYKYLVLSMAAALISVSASASGTVDHRIASGDYSLCVAERGGVAVMRGTDTIAFNDKPAEMACKLMPDSSLRYMSLGYGKVEVCPDGSLACMSRISVPDGTLFIMTDNYRADSAGVFVMDRSVRVDSVGTTSGRHGFRTSYTLMTKYSKNIATEYFIPSIIYRDTTCMRPGAIASSMDVDAMYVKETRAGMPLTMLRNRADGHTVALLHYRPEITVGGCAGGGSAGDIDGRLKFGSLGYVDRDGTMGVSYNYPSVECPVTYESGRWRRGEAAYSDRYHDASPSVDHHYSIAIIPGVYDSYNDAMTSTYLRAYEIEDPEIRKVDMDTIYEQNIALLDAEWRSLGTGRVKAAGLPWSLALPDGENTEGISYQMGFVGQQIAVGYHLFRYGTEHNNPQMKGKGRAILDFWTSEAINSTYFPTVWWDPADDEAGGRRRDYPSFLRCMTDGMESLLDACVYARSTGAPENKWEAVLDTVVSRLVAKQNPDGSFYRAYRTDGSVEEGGDRNTFGMSKMNTHIPVRLLAKMYRHTSDARHRRSALKAADYAYKVFYRDMGKYVGGTPDNPNTVDKEAAIYALYCFNAAHDLTGDSAYLKAAEHAALNAMSWTYCYDFAIPDRNESDRRKNPFKSGGILGFSIIATGHSGADNFISYMCHEMFRLYAKTKKPVYRLMASFLQNNTKLNTDYDGRTGYKYRAFMPEATNVADLAFRSVSLWLPWSSIANIDPLLRLRDEYGQMDVDMIDEP